MMDLKVIVANKTLIANPVLTVIGQMPSSFVRRKRAKVSFVGLMTNVKDTVSWENVMMALKVIHVKKTLIVKDTAS